MSLSKLGLLTIAFSAAIAATSPVKAETTLETPTVTRITVKYSDLNLRSVKGATTLVKRISRAARRTCGDRQMVGPAAFEKRERRAECIRQAEAAAVAAVDQPIVTAVYAQLRGSIAATVATR